MPTAAIRDFRNTYLLPCENDEEAIQMPVNLVAGTYAKGTVLGEVTATPGTFKAYASGASDGSQVPKCILKYAVVVDGSQNYWYGDTSGSSEWGNAQKYGIAYRSGVFNCADLVGFD